MTGEDLASALRGYRFNFNTEDELQQGIARALDNEQVSYEREAILTGRDRIDFLCGRIGIEVKTEGSRADVLRQLHRYCGLDKIDELILVSRKHRHSLGLSESLRGKPVHVIHVGSF